MSPETLGPGSQEAAQERALSTAAAAPAPVVAPPPRSFEHTRISGRFNQYTSGFWGLALPAISFRYLFRGISQFFELHKRENPYWLRRLYPIVTGVGMWGVTALYATRTYGDMKRVFRETLAWEFDKAPEKVNFFDFWRSGNAIVHRTLMNFFKYNARRTAATATIFNSLDPILIGKRIDNPKINDKFDVYTSVDVGMGVTAGYLVTDVLWRKQTFFEALQTFMDSKINHTETIQVVGAPDLINLYAIHARDNGAKTEPPAGNVRLWQNRQFLFGRMAELMNQTYSNVPAREAADFTVPKFLYLLGNGLIKPEKLEQSLTLIEIANRYGMNAVKTVARAFDSNQDPVTATKNFPVNLQELKAPGMPTAEARSTALDPAFTDRVGGKARPAARPPTHGEKAAQRG